jgi:hypothetical protein
MNLTLSIDEETVREARRRAEAMGTSVNQLIREYLQQLANSANASATTPVGRKFNRDELHERK